MKKADVHLAGLLLSVCGAPAIRLKSAIIGRVRLSGGNSAAYMLLRMTRAG